MMQYRGDSSIQTDVKAVVRLTLKFEGQVNGHNVFDCQQVSHFGFDADWHGHSRENDYHFDNVFYLEMSRTRDMYHHWSA